MIPVEFAVLQNPSALLQNTGDKRDLYGNEKNYVIYLSYMLTHLVVVLSVQIFNGVFVVVNQLL